MAEQQGQALNAGQRPLHLIDAFAAGPFTGNPAAIVLLAEPADPQWMQQLAMEMNQAETAYLVPRDDGYALRWFTPAAEVDLCGHATLAAAHFLWEGGHLALDAEARFHTRSGLLTASRDADGWIMIDLPAIRSALIPAPPTLAQALGVTPRSVLLGDFDLLCVVESARAVRDLKPDQRLLATLDVRGIIVTAAGDTPDIDFVSRCFFPRLGIPEDPVTGSAHCALAPYWEDVLGTSTLVARQASPRGGTLRCTVTSSRVQLSGLAVTTLRGLLAV
ncbi:MAG: PhzF family phenazine biosynthesis protein [Gemmatimonadota bacterium]